MRFLDPRGSGPGVSVFLGGMNVMKVYRPSVVILQEKHHTYYFEAQTREKLHAVLLDVLNQRTEQGYYQGAALEAARSAIRTKNGRAAERFLLSRAEHEYEGIWVQPFDTSYVPS